MPEDKFLSRSFKTFLADKLKKKGFKAASPENLSARQVLGVPNLSSGNLEPQFSICQTNFLSSRKLREKVVLSRWLETNARRSRGLHCEQRHK